MQLPRLLDTNLHEVARLTPLGLSIELNLAPLSTAVMELPPDGPAVDTGDLVELFTPMGSAGVFRVQQAEQTFTGAARLHLQHSLITLGDSLIPASSEGLTSTVQEALTFVLSHQDMWQLGTVDVPADVSLTWSYDYSSVLAALLSIMEALPGYNLAFEQSVYPWKLNVVRLPTDDACEARLSRNLRSLTVESDRSELCTRVYVPGLDAPIDADTISRWGVAARSISGDEALTAEELTAHAQQYLEAHKNPLLTVTLDALDLSRATGEPFDTFLPGRMCRVCLPDHGQTIRQQVVSLSWPDLVADEEKLQVTLASRAETTVDTLAGLIVDTTVQRRLIHKNVQALDKLVVRTIANEEEISIITPQLTILAGEVEAKADRILLDAYVKITELEATNAQIANLTNGITKAIVLDAVLMQGDEGQFTYLTANSFTLANRKAQWKSDAVGSGVVNVTQSKRYLNVMLADGSSTSLDIVTDVKVTGGQTRINYLGQNQEV